MEVDGVDGKHKSDSNGMLYTMVVPGTHHVKVKAPGYDPVEQVRMDFLYTMVELCSVILVVRKYLSHACVVVIILVRLGCSNVK